MVTVIVRTYNRADVLPRALDSLLAQSYSQLEILIIDDASSDGTPAVVAEYQRRDPRIRCVRHPTNQGPSAAFNTGFDHARGDLVTGLDSDDELLPEAVESQVAALEALGPAYGMVVANGQDGATAAWTGRGLSADADVSFGDVLCARIAGDFWGLWRRDLVGDLRFDPRLPGGEWLVWHELYRRTRVRYLQRALLRCHRENVNRVSRPAYTPEKLRGRALLYSTYLERFGADLLRLCPGRCADLHHAHAAWLLMAGERGRAAASLWVAFRSAPGLRTFAFLGAVLAPRPLVRRVLETRYGS